MSGRSIAPYPLRGRRLPALPATVCADTPDRRDDLATNNGRLKRAIFGSRNPSRQPERGVLLATLSRAESGDAPQRRLVLQQALSEEPLVVGNNVRLLRAGAGVFPLMFRAIATACDHINMEYVIVQDIVWSGTAGRTC